MDFILAIHENSMNSFIQTWYSKNVTLSVNDYQKLIWGDSKITLQDLHWFPRVTEVSGDNFETNVSVSLFKNQLYAPGVVILED